MKRLFVGGILLFALTIASSLGASNRTVIKTYLQNSNPKYIQLSGSNFEGLCYDIMKEIEKLDSSIKFEYPKEFIPFARIELELERGGIDIFLGMIKNPAREAKFNFINPALYPTYNKMVVRADDPIKSISGLDDIRKLGDDGIILVDHGTAHQKFLESQGGLKLDTQGRNRVENLTKLAGGRGRFYYSTDIGLIGTIQDQNLRGKVRFLDHVFLQDAQYAAFSKNCLASEKLEFFNLKS